MITSNIYNICNFVIMKIIRHPHWVSPDFNIYIFFFINRRIRSQHISCTVKHGVYITDALRVLVSYDDVGWSDQRPKPRWFHIVKSILIENFPGFRFFFRQQKNISSLKIICQSICFVKTCFKPILLFHISFPLITYSRTSKFKGV